MEQNHKTALFRYWRIRRRRKSYQLLKLIVASYAIIFAVLLLKNLSQGISFQEVSNLLGYAKGPTGYLSWGWFSAIVLQSASIVAILINSLLGRDLLEVNQSVYLMIGLLIGNSATPLFASLFVQSEKHWNIRHGFEIGFANILLSALVATFVLGLQSLVGVYSLIGHELKSSLGQFTAFGYLPSLLDLLTDPLFSFLCIDKWHFSLSLMLSIILLLWGFSLFGDSIVRYHGGLKRSREKIEEHLGSKWQIFSIGLLLSLLVPSSSLLITLLIPLAAKGVLSLKQAIPFLIATNLATFIDVLLVAFADGAPGAIAGALVLMLMSLTGIIFMNEWLGIRIIHKITRYCTLRFLPQKKRSIVFLLAIYTLTPLILSLL